MATQVRFPPPWTVRHNEDAYWVEDASGQRFVYCYFRDAHSIGSGGNYMTRDGARRIACNVAKLPEMIGVRRQAIHDRAQVSAGRSGIDEGNALRKKEIWGRFFQSW